MGDPNQSSLLGPGIIYQLPEPQTEEEKAFRQNSSPTRYQSQVAPVTVPVTAPSTATGVPEPDYVQMQKDAFIANARAGTDYRWRDLGAANFLERRMREDPTGQNIDKYWNSIYMANVMNADPEFIYNDYDSMAARFTARKVAPAPEALRFALKKAWDNGYATTQLGYLYFNQMSGDSSDYTKERIRAYEAMQKPIDRTEYGFLSQFLLGAADMLPLQIITGIEGAKVGLATAAGMFVAASATAAPVMLVGGATGIGTVPTLVTGGAYVAGATIWGFVTGTRAGSAVEAGKVMTGLAYKQLREIKDRDGNPMSDSTAKWIALPVGALVGIIEVMQMETIAASLSPGLKALLGDGIQQVVKDTVLKTLGNGLVKSLAKYGVDVFGEGVEEGLQEIVQIMGERLAAYIEKEGRNRDFPAQDLQTMATRVWDNTKAGWVGTVLTLAPGHIKGAFVDNVVAAKVSQVNQQDRAKLALIRARTNDLINAGYLNPDAKPTSTVQDLQAPLGEVKPKDPAMTAGFQNEDWDPTKPRPPKLPPGATAALIGPNGEVSAVQFESEEAAQRVFNQPVPIELKEPIAGTVAEAVSKMASDAKPYQFTKEEWARRQEFAAKLNLEKVGVSVFHDIETERYANVRELAKRSAPWLSENEINVGCYLIDMIAKIRQMPFDDFVNEIFAPGIFASPEEMATFDQDVAEAATKHAERMGIEAGWTPEQKATYVGTQRIKAAAARGAARIMDNGRTLVYVMKTGDGRALVEEFIHAARPFIPDHLLSPILKDVGLKPGDAWTEKADEALVDALFVYWMEGHAPSEQARSIFNALGQWIEKLFKYLRDKIVLSPEIVEFFDTIFSGREDGKPNEILKIQPNPRPGDTLDIRFQIDESVEIENDPGKVAPSEWITQSSYEGSIRNVYIDMDGNQRGHTDENGEFHLIHSYATPISGLRLKLGQWLIDDQYRGLYGHEIAQLRRFEYTQIRRLGQEWAPGDVTMAEDLVEQNIQRRGDDAGRYSEWLDQGSTPPPVTIVETDKGTFKITDGHRRANAAIKSQRPLFAWVWPAMQHPEGLLDSSTGKVQVVGMTYEGITGKTFRTEQAQAFLFQIDPKDEARLAKAALLSPQKGGWGATKNPEECGYILRDGTMLDLSGKYNPGRIEYYKQHLPREVQIDANGNEWIPGLEGFRNMDHNEMPPAVLKLIKNENKKRSEWLRRTGAMRVDYHTPIIEAFEEPTPKQLKALDKMYNGRSVWCELCASDGSTIYSSQLSSATAERISDWFVVAPIKGEKSGFLFQTDPESPEDIEAFNKKATEYYGTTEDFKKCGFILSNGAMLDFNNKFGETVTVMENGRAVHRSIAKMWNVQLVDALQKALRFKTIRMAYDRSYTALQTCFEPTEYQYGIIDRLVKETGQLDIELTDPRTGRMVTFFQFKRGTSVQMIRYHFSAYEHYSDKFLFQTDPWLHKSIEVLNRFPNKIDKQPAEVVRNIFINNGVKAEEMKWNDLDDYLEARKGKKIDVEDLKGFLAGHAVRIEEITLSYPSLMATPEQRRQAAEPSAQRTRPRYPEMQYQSRIGTNYRELVFRLPWDTLPEGTPYYRVIPGHEETVADIDQRMKNLRAALEAIHVRDPDTDWRTGGRRELRMQIAELAYQRKEHEELNPYMMPEKMLSSKYEGNPHYAGIDNVFGWARFKDYYHEGKKVLLIDEVQSEWFQNVRQAMVEWIERTAKEKNITTQEATKLFKDEYVVKDADGMVETLSRNRQIEARIDAADARLSVLRVHVYHDLKGDTVFEWAQDTTLEDGTPFVRKVAVARGKVGDDGHFTFGWNTPFVQQYGELPMVKKIEEAVKDYAAKLDARSTIMPEAGKYPNAPFIKTWVEVVLKRMMRWAADGGYDAIMWTSGEMQKQRWSLSRHIEELSVRKWASGQVDLTGARKNTYGEDVILFEKNGIHPRDIHKYVGNELADKIIAIPSPEPESAYSVTRSFSGLDLDILGGGMYFQYDRLMPQFMDSMGKKFGQKTRLTKVGSNEYHIIEINDAMKESAKKGFYLFQGDPHMEAVRNAVNLRLAVPDEVLAEYRNEEWAKEEIAAREAHVSEALSGDFKDFDEYVDYHDALNPEGVPVAEYDYWRQIWDRAKKVNPHIESVQFRALSKVEANARFVNSVNDPGALGRYFDKLVRLSDGEFDPSIFPKSVRIAFEAARIRRNDKNVDVMTDDIFLAAIKTIKGDAAFYRALLAQFGDDVERQQLLSEGKKQKTEADQLRAAQLAILRSVKGKPPTTDIGGREVWRITKKDWIAAYPPTKRKPMDFLRMHEYAVRQAVEMGIDPPPEVLDDYPYLRQRIEENKRKPREWTEPRSPFLFAGEERVEPKYTPEQEDIIKEALDAMGRPDTPRERGLWSDLACKPLPEFLGYTKNRIDDDLATRFYNALFGPLELTAEADVKLPRDSRIRQELFGFAEKSGVQLQDELDNLNLFPEVETPKVPESKEVAPDPQSGVPPTPEAKALVTPKVMEPEPRPTQSILGPSGETDIPYTRGEFPIEEINHHPDIWQFKRKANKRGVVKALTGKKYIRVGIGPIILWRTIDGKVWIVTGRHRLDLAQRLGEKTIPADIFEEKDGFTIDMARIMDAEANIRDGQGEVFDYAKFFRGTGITEQQAFDRGLLARSAGKAGFALGSYASDDLYNGYVNDRISEDKAAAIALGAPRNPGVQRAAFNKALEDAKLTPDELENYAALLAQVYGERKEDGTRTVAGDGQIELIKMDKSFDDELIAEAKAAAKIINDMKEELGALKAARRLNKKERQKYLAKYNVKVENVEEIDARIDVLEADVVKWGLWQRDHDLHNKVREAAGLSPLRPDAVSPSPPESVGPQEVVAAPPPPSYEVEELPDVSGVPAENAPDVQPTPITEEQVEEVAASEEVEELPDITEDGKEINKHGSIQDAEVVCDENRKLWSMKIRVAKMPQGWVYGTDVSYKTGGMAGMGMPVSASGPFFPTVEDAVLEALAVASHHFSLYAQEGYHPGPNEITANTQVQKYIADKAAAIRQAIEQKAKEEAAKAEPSQDTAVPIGVSAPVPLTPEAFDPVTPEAVAQKPELQQEIARQTKKGAAKETPAALPGGQLAMNITVSYAQLEAERRALQEQIDDLKEGAKTDKAIYEEMIRLTNLAGRLEKQIAVEKMRAKMKEKLDLCWQRRKEDRERWKANEASKREQKQVDRILNDLRRIRNNLKYMHKEAAEPIADLLEDIDLSINGKSFIKRLGKLKTALETTEEIDFPADWLDALDDVAGKSIYALTYPQLQALANAVMFWYNYNKDLEVVRIAGESQRHEDAVETAIDEMKPEKELLDNLNSTQPPGSKRWDSVKRFLNTLMGIGQMQYSLIVEWIAGPDSFIHRIFVTQIEEGRRHEFDLKHAWEDFWTARMELIGIDNMPRWLAEEYTMEYQPGKTLTITRGQKLSLYLHSLNLDNRESVTGAGIGFRRNRELRNRPLKVSDAALNAIAPTLTDQEKAMISVAQDLMEMQADAMDPVYEQRYGFPFPRIQHYWRKDVMPVGIGKTTEEQSALEAARRRTMRPGPPKNRIKERKGVVVPIYLNSIEQEIMDSINEAAAYAGLEIPIYQAYKLLADRDFKQALKDRYGEQLVNEVNNGIRDIVGESHALPLIEQYFAKTRQMMQTAYLTLNPFTWLKLMLGYLNGLQYVKAQYMAQGFADFIMHPKRVDAINQAMSPYYRDRLEIGFTRDVAEPQKTYESGKLIKARSWYKKLGVKPLQLADRTAVNPVMRGAYLQAIRELETGDLSEATKRALAEQLRGHPPNTLQAHEKIALAYRFADWVVQRTQDQRLPEYRSPLSRATALGGITKFFTMFGSNTNTNLNMILRAFNNAKSSGWSRSSMQKLAGTMFLMMVIVPASEALVNAIRNFMLRRYGDDEERWKQVLNDYGSNVFSLSYFLRDAWQAINASVRGQWGSEITIAPLQVINDTYRATADVIKAATDTGTYTGNKWVKALDEVAEVTMIYTQFPGIMPKRYIQEIIKRSKE